jgi:hypothetical protein
MPGSSLGQQRQLVTVFERQAAKGGKQDFRAKILALPAVIKAPLIRKAVVKNGRIFQATKPIGSEQEKCPSFFYPPHRRHANHRSRQILARRHIQLRHKVARTIGVLLFSS